MCRECAPYWKDIGRLDAFALSRIRVQQARKPGHRYAPTCSHRSARPTSRARQIELPSLKCSCRLPARCRKSILTFVCLRGVTIARLLAIGTRECVPRRERKLVFQAAQGRTNPLGGFFHWSWGFATSGPRQGNIALPVKRRRQAIFPYLGRAFGFPGHVASTSK